MNERIRELANQMFSMEQFEYAEEFINDEFMEKFAELIVRECLLCCERTISDPVPKSVDTFEQGGIHCMDEIKYHFGVEK